MLLNKMPVVATKCCTSPLRNAMLSVTHANPAVVLHVHHTTSQGDAPSTARPADQTPQKPDATTLKSKASAIWTRLIRPNSGRRSMSSGGKPRDLNSDFTKTAGKYTKAMKGKTAQSHDDISDLSDTAAFYTDEMKSRSSHRRKDNTPKYSYSSADTQSMKGDTPQRHPDNVSDFSETASYYTEQMRVKTSHLNTDIPDFSDTATHGCKSDQTKLISRKVARKSKVAVCQKGKIEFPEVMVMEPNRKQQRAVHFNANVIPPSGPDTNSLVV